MPKRASAASSVAEGGRPDVKMIRAGAGVSPLALGPLEIGHPPGDRRCRIDEGHRPWREPLQTAEQQWIMRAGEHDRVGTPPIRIDETWRDFLRDQRIRDRSALQLRLRERREPCRSHERDVGTIGEVADQRAGVFATDRRLGAEYRHPLGDGLRAGRLDRRHRADEGDGEPCAQMGENQGGGGVAGDDNEIRTMRLDQVAHEGHHTCDQLRLAMAAVRKEGIVGGVDVAGVGARLEDLAKHGEAPEPGIEHENGRCNSHGAHLVRKEWPPGNAGRMAVRSARVPSTD